MKFYDIYICKRLSPCYLFQILRPPALPRRLQRSTIGRTGLNRRVRYGNGCVPGTHHHSKYLISFGLSASGLKWTRTTDLTLIRRAL